MILEKALTLESTQFEDSEFYDKLTRARREASSRPLSLVMRTFGLLQNAVSLVSFGGLLVRFSPWAVVLLVLAGLPAFLAEAKFSGEAFRLFRWRAPESRMQIYLESVLARERHRQGGQAVPAGSALPRPLPGHLHAAVPRGSRPHCAPRCLGLRPGTARHRRRCTAATRGSPRRPCSGAMTVGQMTMYLMLLRQGQAAVSAALTAGQRPVRGQSLSVELSSNTWSSRSGAASGSRQARPAARRRHPLRGRRVRLSRRGGARAVGRSICTCGPARAWRWSGRTARARPP